MTIRITRLALASITILLALTDAATAQRGGRGGGGGGRVGGGGGMVGRGGGGNFARPSMPQNFSRPANLNQNFSRPTNINQNFNRPTNINQNINRPTNVNQNINRPTNINQNINRPTNLNQTNINNRQNFSSNNTVINNNVTNVNRVNNANNFNRGNYGGYGGSLGGYGGGNRGWGGNGFYGSGYHGNSYYGYHSNWVNGSWGGNYRPGWGGYGGYGGFGGYGGYGFGSGLGLGLGLGAGLGIASWGLGSLYNNWGYSQYSNPYYASAYSAQPANFAVQSVGYDYSMPLNLSSSPPDETVIQSSVASIDSAREAFHAGDYPRALDLSDQALKQTPNDPMLHEFRATCLFALGRYDEAAVPFYTVLSAGPGWDWTTLIGLYPDVDTYTNQLRALENYCNSNPRAASARFVLAAIYLTQGSKDAAAARLQQVVAIQPQDRLSGQLLQAINAEAQSGQVASQGQPPQGAGPGTPPVDIPPANPSPTQGAAATPEAPALPTGPVPANLIGTWTATPAQGVTITMNLVDDKSFAWKVVEKGQTREFKGEAHSDNGVLALNSPDLPPMVANVTSTDAAHFKFKAVGSPAEDPGLNFSK
jgi:tetratricopeptide (TPR) repeat protein